MIDDQAKVYKDGKEVREESIAKAANKMVQLIGQDGNFTYDTPIRSTIEEADLIDIFMVSVFGLVIFFLGILAAQLIYSLMLTDVDSKTYEFGMLRALGFNTNNIFMLIFTSALNFATPGLLAGLAIAAAFNAFCRFGVYWMIKIYSSYGLTSSSLIVGVLLGIVLPLLANIVPIQKALGKNLRQSLDINHMTSSEVMISIKRLSTYGMSAT